jgi:antitoxin MazE
VRVAKWGNSLAVRIPNVVVKALKLKSGDEIEIVVSREGRFEIGRDRSREGALEHLRALKKPPPRDSVSTGMRPMPDDRFFDTHILIYAFAAGDCRSAAAEAPLAGRRSMPHSPLSQN